MRDTGSPAARYIRDTGSPVAGYVRDTGSPAARYIKETGSPAAGYMRDSIDLIWRKRVYALLSDVLVCHFHPSSSSDVLPEVSVCHLLQSPLTVVLIPSFSSVMSFCHSLLSYLFGILNLSFTVPFLSLYFVISCVIILSCAFVIISWHSICQFATYNRCGDLLLIFCSAMFFCRSPVVSSVIFLCHCLLSCCSVVFFSHFLLSSSFGILKLLFTVVFCS